MRKTRLVMGLIVTLGVVTCLSFKSNDPSDDIAVLKALYSSGDSTKWPKATIDSNTVGFQEIGRLGAVSYPADNLPNPEKVKLGKLLFYDGRLSQSNQIACASCHDPQLGWGDGKKLGFGHDRKLGKRNVMTLFNTAFYTKLFWDGRAKSLEDQARFPIADHVEMNIDPHEMAEKIQAFKGYKPMFKEAFGDDSISLDRILKAIATFERTIVSKKSRFDIFVKGNKEALTDDEIMGLHLFRTKARCINCHNGPLFSDNQFHNDGQTLWGTANEDLGRYNVTKDKKDIGAFKTPSLREVAATGPWFHHGNFTELKDIVSTYNLGNPANIPKKYLGTPRDSLLPTPSPLIKKLGLTPLEQKQVIAFLEALTNSPMRVKVPTEFPE